MGNHDGVWERRCVGEKVCERLACDNVVCVCEYKPLNETVKSCNEL